MSQVFPTTSMDISLFYPISDRLHEYYPIFTRFPRACTDITLFSPPSLGITLFPPSSMDITLFCRILDRIQGYYPILPYFRPLAWTLPYFTLFSTTSLDITLFYLFSDRLLGYYPTFFTYLHRTSSLASRRPLTTTRDSLRQRPVPRSGPSCGTKPTNSIPPQSREPYSHGKCLKIPTRSFPVE